MGSEGMCQCLCVCPSVNVCVVFCAEAEEERMCVVNERVKTGGSVNKLTRRSLVM